MPLYQVAVVSKLTKEQRERNECERLIMEPAPVIAADERMAAVKAITAKAISAEDISSAEVLVVPFS